MRPVTVLPSLLSADFSQLATELERCEAAGARRIHLDVMDGHFVPNITIGPPVIAAIRARTALPLDVHLMISDPVRYLGAFREAGADTIYIHPEAVGPRAIDDALEALRGSGAETGLAFNPDTDVAMWMDAIDRVDSVMLMTVYPGFGGQEFIGAVRPRLRALRAARPGLPIQVDGGIGRETVPLVTADGADRLVTGSAFFKDPDPPGFLRWAEGHQAS
ncbi:MAG: ribulose-phosphate 3-epimerase [Planctomycetota bacterium]